MQRTRPLSRIVSYAIGALASIGFAAMTLTPSHGQGAPPPALSGEANERSTHFGPMLKVFTKHDLSDEAQTLLASGLRQGRSCAESGSGGGGWKPEYYEPFVESLDRFVGCLQHTDPELMRDAANMLGFAFWRAARDPNGHRYDEGLVAYYAELGEAVLDRRIEILKSHPNFPSEEPDAAKWDAVLREARDEYAGLIRSRLEDLQRDWLTPAFRRELTDEELERFWESTLHESPDKGDYDARISPSDNRDEEFARTLRGALRTQAHGFFGSAFLATTSDELTRNECFGLMKWGASGSDQLALDTDCWPFIFKYERIGRLTVEEYNRAKEMYNEQF